MDLWRTVAPGQNYSRSQAALAGALEAEKVIYLTDIAGLLMDVDDPSTIVARTSVSELNELRAKGIIRGGMVPKVQACIDAVNSGAGSAHMLDGRIPHVLLLELFTDAGIGTMVTADPEPVHLHEVH